jgi:pimeloyl-ACP methyl ester carboxylesterase
MAIEMAGGPVHLVGHSMGGAVAALAAAQSHKVLSLTLVSTPPRGVPDCLQRAEAASAGMDAVLPATLSRWFGTDWEMAGPREILEYARRSVMAMQPEGWAAAWRALASFKGFEGLPTFATPALAITAEDDLSTPPRVLGPMAEAWERAGCTLEQAVVLKGGHLLPITQPAILAGLLTKHWATAGS